jgi:hypothetical protein
MTCLVSTSSRIITSNCFEGQLLGERGIEPVSGRTLRRIIDNNNRRSRWIPSEKQFVVTLDAFSRAYVSLRGKAAWPWLIG